MKAPPVPKPPPVPTRQTAEDAADQLRQRIAARRGYDATIRTSGLGASDFGKNAQVPGLSGGASSSLGVG